MRVASSGAGRPCLRLQVGQRLFETLTVALGSRLQLVELGRYRLVTRDCALRHVALILDALLCSAAQRLSARCQSVGWARKRLRTVGMVVGTVGGTVSCAATQRTERCCANNRTDNADKGTHDANKGTDNADMSVISGGASHRSVPSECKTLRIGSSPDRSGTHRHRPSQWPAPA